MNATHPNAYGRALEVLERMQDRELLEAYRRFAARLQQILTPEEMDVYASFQQRTTGGVRPEEQVIADKVAADAEATSLYDSYLQVLSTRR